MGLCRISTCLGLAVRRLRGEGGFTLVETMMATMLLMAVGMSLSGVLASSVVTYSSSRERTLAQQLTMDQVEAIRRMPFSQVGTPNANPAGTLSAVRAIDATGLEATMKVKVQYVDDQTPNSYRTYANYKKVTITVVRDRDAKELVREITYLSSAAKNSATESVIDATVLDMGNNTPVVGATVNLLTGPSAPRADATDASGKAIFPSLTANPSSGGQAFYDLAVVVPFGYEALKDDLSPSAVAHTQLGVAQTWPTVLRLYKPSTVSVSTPAPLAPLTTTPVPYTLSFGSGRVAEAFPQPAGTTFIPSIATLGGEKLVPYPSSAQNISEYMVGLSAVYGTGTSAKYLFSTAVSKPVPQSYPSNLTQSFTLLASTNWLASTAVKALTIKVQNAAGVLGGMQVAVSGGPGVAPGIYVVGTTATSGTSKGMVTINVPTGSNYTITAWGPSTRAQLTAQSITSAVTKTLTVT